MCVCLVDPARSPGAKLYTYDMPVKYRFPELNSSYTGH
jgi:hypothetical protein